MKRFTAWSTACAAVMLLTGCGTQEPDPMKSELTVSAPEELDTAYTDCLKTYFEAIENKDFAAYQSVVYPPYMEVYKEYLKKSDKTVEAAFETLCTKFDEDGYERWHITGLEAAEAEGGEDGVNSFFDAFVAGGVFDEAFKEQCRKDTNEVRDIQFSLSILYEGDEEPVPVATGSEILMMKTDTGTYLFG